ncbi:MAG TPA: VOC family protein [Solirubrobacteraceae bacterium]|nr:VOC family protein [Solirubrobacteraceae bacterium]
MFDHVTIRVSDFDDSERFYTTVLQALGIEQSARTETFARWQDFIVIATDPDHPPARRLHVGFVAPSRELVDAFWRAGTEAGFRDDGAPGLRPQYAEDYYGGFLLDPDGNSAEAVHDNALRRGGIVDHLWIRVADLDRARAFYDTIAPHAGIRKDRDTTERVQYRGATGSFSLLAGPPTEQLHMAFATDDDGDVQRFHQAGVGAGHRSNGEPGERPQYHPGYYAAFLLDPDGNNIEVVNHHR